MEESNEAGKKIAVVAHLLFERQADECDDQLHYKYRHCAKCRCPNDPSIGHLAHCGPRTAVHMKTHNSHQLGVKPSKS